MDIKVLNSLVSLNFKGKGESFVEQKFVTPFLECVGYEKEKDYEVRRHGDEDMSFKLKYPPVEKGAERIKHYNPDYMPTIRRKLYWIIEVKSPKNIKYPFNYENIMQGLQYCIHPEIQARYLVLTNGEYTDIYDPHMAVFNDGNMYKPLLSFSNKELKSKWKEIYEYLSPEYMRKNIEKSLKLLYEQTAGSSLDYKYPFELAKNIIKKQGVIAKAIEKEIREQELQAWRSSSKEYQKFLESLPSSQILHMMNYPFSPGKSEGQWYTEKAFKENNADQVFKSLIVDYDRQPVFKKEQTFAALCTLYNLSENANIRNGIMNFLQSHKELELPLLNRVECISIRLIRKVLVVYVYPLLRDKINKNLKITPEINRFINPPNAFTSTYHWEVDYHHKLFNILLTLPENKLKQAENNWTKLEKEINPAFEKARKELPDDEKQIINSFEEYGKDGISHSLVRIMDYLLQIKGDHIKVTKDTKENVCRKLKPKISSNINVIGSIPDYRLIYDVLYLYAINSPLESIHESIIEKNNYGIRTVESRGRFLRGIKGSFWLFKNKKHEELIRSLFKHDGFEKTKQFSLFWMMVINNKLFEDITKEVFIKVYFSGRVQIRKDDVVAYLYHLKETNMGLHKWSDSTLKTVSSKYLLFLKKINLLKGKQKKEFSYIQVDDISLIFFIYLIKAVEPEQPDILKNRYIDFLFIEKTEIINRFKKAIFANFFYIETTGMNLKIDLKYDHGEILDVLSNRT